MARSISKAVAALARDITFRDIRLVEAQVKQSIRAGLLPKKTQVTALVQAQAIEGAEEKLVRFLPALTLEVRYEDDPDKKLGIFIVARYQITYGATSLRHAKEGTLAEFGAEDAMPMVWPYWQEFVASMLGRMGLPHFRIEPFRKASLVRGDLPPELQSPAIPKRQARKK